MVLRVVSHDCYRVFSFAFVYMFEMGGLGVSRTYEVIPSKEMEKRLPVRADEENENEARSTFQARENPELKGQNSQAVSLGRNSLTYARANDK